MLGQPGRLAAFLTSVLPSTAMHPDHHRQIQVRRTFFGGLAALSQGMLPPAGSMLKVRQVDARSWVNVCVAD